MDYQLFEAGDVTLQSGAVFPAMKLAYKTYGSLNAAKDNVVVYPTSFSAQHGDTEWLIKPDGVLNPDQYFVIIPNLFGSGLSSSPSNTPGDFPMVTYHDAVAVQRRLVTEIFGISKIALVYGWSMGGAQAYHWASSHSDMVERAAVICGSARCAPYNKVFLEGVKAALTSDPAYKDGRFTAQATVGMRAMGRVYAGWALSHAFFRDELWREGGFTSLEDFLVRAWDGNFARRHANDLMAQIRMWEAGDISQCDAFGGDYDRALAAVTCRILLMPGTTDRYFDVRDNADDMPKLINARSKELRPIPSDYGHRAGNPAAIPADRAFLKQAIAELLNQ